MYGILYNLLIFYFFHLVTLNQMHQWLIYQSQIFYPQYIDVKNGFYEYILESPITVSGSLFIGWEQYYDEIINVGLDKNIINNDRMFYNLGAGWNQSNCADCDGTWMIRPVFGSLTSTSIDNGLNSSFLSITVLELHCSTIFIKIFKI